MTFICPVARHKASGASRNQITVLELANDAIISVKESCSGFENKSASHASLSLFPACYMLAMMGGEGVSEDTLSGP